MPNDHRQSGAAHEDARQPEPSGISPSAAPSDYQSALLKIIRIRDQ